MAMGRTVRADAAEGAGNDVDEAKRRSDDASGRLGEGEVFVKVLRGDVGHGELDAEAEAVGDGEDPCINVR